VLAAAVVLLWRRELLGPTVRTLAPMIIPSSWLPAPRHTAQAAVLERELLALSTLVVETEQGRLLPASDQVLVVVNQGLIQQLLTTLTPAEYVVLDKYRVRVDKATVSFEDGLALVRLDGRVSLAGVMEPEVFAELTAFGDLQLAEQQLAAGVLRARIHLIGVEARRVEVVVRTRDAEALVRELSRAKLEEFAALASSVEIPVAQQHEITIPAAAGHGPLRIQSDSIPVRLSVLDVAAFHQRLWISMAVSMGTAAPPRVTPRARAPSAPARGRKAPGDPRQLHVALHRRLEELIEKEPRLLEAERTPGDIVAALSTAVARDLLREVAQRYLDRVEVELSDIEVDKAGSIEKDTFFGRMHGDWKARVRIQRVRGVLRAGTPRVDFNEGNWMIAAMPVSLEGGQGIGDVAFSWDAHSLAKLVCRDFEVSQPIDGRVLPNQTPLTARFLLSASPGALRAEPRFEASFRLHVELSRRSWDAVREKLEQQDTLLKCGIALDPDNAMSFLHELVDHGFRVRLPSHLLRPIRLQTPLNESVDVQDRRVHVEVARSNLRVTPEALWYSATLQLGAPGRVEQPPPSIPHAF
jgi:hypothetical protein